MTSLLILVYSSSPPSYTFTRVYFHVSASFATTEVNIKHLLTHGCSLSYFLSSLGSVSAVSHKIMFIGQLRLPVTTHLTCDLATDGAREGGGMHGMESKV